jgi:hypothetical protein
MGRSITRVYVGAYLKIEKISNDEFVEKINENFNNDDMSEIISEAYCDDFIHPSEGLEGKNILLPSKENCIVELTYELDEFELEIDKDLNSKLENCRLSLQNVYASWIEKLREIFGIENVKISIVIINFIDEMA